ncbi:MAG: hypothetical protein K6F31_01000 [Acetatifactor sp.]|nr:hypothetical protein [Acetatifactor sp.]
MEDALAIFALIGIVLLVCAILVLGGAFVWPKLTEAIVENFYTSPGYGRHLNIIYIFACLSSQIRENTVDRDKKYAPLPEEEEKEKVDWKCPNCGRYNHSFQEMCACGQDRDDVKL